jgi:hypothetical protein
MLLSWAAAWKCKWLELDELKDKVIEAIKQETKLPTPLNIKDFIIATVDVTNKQELLNILNAKSQETAKSFAEEIKHITQDKIILFFSFLFISDYFTENFVKSQYQALAKELNISIDNWEFDRILRQFRGSKIDTSKEYIRFSHPSYSEALPYLLLEDGFPTEINTGIFSKVLVKLADNKEASEYDVWNVASAVSSNFDKLPDNVRNELLVKLADKLLYNFDEFFFQMVRPPSIAKAVANIISSNFDKLPDNVRNELLVKLADNKEAAREIPWTICSNFDKLPESIRNELLFKLAENKETSLSVAQAVANNYEKLHHDNVRNLLFKLADNKEAASDVASAVSSNFDKLPDNVRNELLVKLADNKEDSYVVWKIAIAVSRNFDKLPESIRNELLVKLADVKYTVHRPYQDLGPGADVRDRDMNLLFGQVILNTVSQNFDKLPDNVRNELLLKLAENKEAAGDIADAVSRNFDKLPDNVRNELLVKLADNHTPEVFVKLIKIIVMNSDKLPYNAMNFVFKYLDNR